MPVADLFSSQRLNQCCVWLTYLAMLYIRRIFDVVPASNRGQELTLTNGIPRDTRGHRLGGGASCDFLAWFLIRRHEAMHPPPSTNG